MEKDRLQRTLIILVVGLSIFLSAGCGFHLKGWSSTDSSQIKLKSIYPVYENVSASFRQEFQQLLGDSGQRAIDPEFANIKIIFLNERWKRQSLSVSDTGVPAEYRLSCIITYRFEQYGVENNFEIIERRDFKSNHSHLLAIDSQQSLLKRQILQNIANQLVNQRFN